jgi:hypothetical protein
MVVAVKIRAGCACDIYVLEHNGRIALMDFLSGLESSAHKEYVKIMALLARTADHGPMYGNYERFKRLRDDIFEFKTHGGVRILCFFDGRSIIVLTNGFKKKKEYADEIIRAVHLRTAYMNAKINDSLTYRDEL